MEQFLLLDNRTSIGTHIGTVEPASSKENAVHHDSDLVWVSQLLVRVHVLHHVDNGIRFSLRKEVCSCRSRRDGHGGDSPRDERVILGKGTNSLLDGTCLHVRRGQFTATI